MHCLLAWKWPGLMRVFIAHYSYRKRTHADHCLSLIYSFHCWQYGKNPMPLFYNPVIQLEHSNMGMSTLFWRKCLCLEQSRFLINNSFVICFLSMYTFLEKLSKHTCHAVEQSRECWRRGYSLCVRARKGETNWVLHHSEQGRSQRENLRKAP